MAKHKTHYIVNSYCLEPTIMKWLQPSQEKKVARI